MTRSILTLADLDREALQEILAASQHDDLGKPLAGKGAALVFQKPSARTRNSMEMAVVQLGGHPVYIQKDEVGLGTRESPEDVARTLACYHALIAARVMDHRHLDQMATVTRVPLLNMLSDTDHPLQALADLLTVKQLVGQLEGARIAYVGDANNVARSLAQGCALLGTELRIASPAAYGFPAEELARYGGAVTQTDDPQAAVAGAQVVYTDVWVSMGQDEETEARRKAFASYQVNEALMAKSDDAWFLHCLPAKRGEEVTDGVIDSAKSAVWRQAKNRMHTARGAMAWMLGDAAMIEPISSAATLRAKRQKAIADLIRGEVIASQEDVTERLAALGFAVTQATVSRDLDQLGAVKVKRGGVLSYALPDQMAKSDWTAERLERILREWVLSVEASGTLLVLRTPPASAHLVASAIDQVRPHEIAGTVAGDDTLFIAIRDGFSAEAVAARLRALSGQA